MDVKTADDTITRALIEEGIRRGYVVSVFSGEEGPDIARSSNVTEIMEHARAVDECKLYFLVQAPAEVPRFQRLGWIYLVFGEYGWDVIADHTDNEATNALVNAIQPTVNECERQLNATKAGG